MTITLIKLTCNSLVNPAGDLVAVRVCGSNFATFFFNSAGETNSLPSSPFGENVSIELIVKINASGANKSMGTRITGVNPSPVPFALPPGDYSLTYM